MGEMRIRKPLRRVFGARQRSPLVDGVCPRVPQRLRRACGSKFANAFR
jgi:hypothetical protein